MYNWCIYKIVIESASLSISLATHFVRICRVCQSRLVFNASIRIPVAKFTVYTHVHWPLSETECEINSTLSTYIMPQDQNIEFSATVKGIGLLTRFSYRYPELSIDVGFRCMCDRKMCVTKEKFMNLTCFL